MKTVPVAGERAKYEDDGASLRVILPPRRSAFVVVFLAFWLAMWFVGARTAQHQLITPGANASRGFLMIWLTVWILGGVFAAYAFVWMLFGREIIELRPDELILRRALFGIGRSRAYALAQVKDLRIGPVVPEVFDGTTFQRMFGERPQRRPDFSRAAAAWGLAGGPIVFDYGTRTIRCGACLDEAEGKMVVERLRRRNSWLRVEGAA